VSEIESDVMVLYQELAHRLRTLGAMFTDLATEDGAERLLGSLVADDPRDLRELIGRYDLPKFPELGLCVWVREVLDSVLLTPNVDQRCAIRPDLTPHERLSVLLIAGKHAVLLIEPFDEQTIAPGPFLDELKARKLVNCKPTSASTGPLNLLGPPHRFCA
jgi:hypothetical protein